MRLFITIEGDFDARLLWNLIEKYKVNLTELEHVTLVYGDVDASTAAEVLVCCAPFGKIKLELSNGSQ